MSRNLRVKPLVMAIQAVILKLIAKRRAEDEMRAEAGQNREKPREP